MKRAILLSAFAIFFAGTTVRAQSHMASHQFGLGLYIQSPTGIEAPGGISLNYALSHDIQLGSYFGLLMVSQGGSNTMFAFEPYFRYLISAPVNPFIEGQFLVISPGGTTNVGVGFGGGLSYGIGPNFNLAVDMRLFGVAFTDPATIEFGFSDLKLVGTYYF
jgi:hypothetical protein